MRTSEVQLNVVFEKVKLCIMCKNVHSQETLKAFKSCEAIKIAVK